MSEPRMIHPFVMGRSSQPVEGDFSIKRYPVDQALEEETPDPKGLSAQESAPSLIPPESSEQPAQPTSMPEGLEQVSPTDIQEVLAGPAPTVSAEKVSTPAKVTAPSMPPSLPSPKSGPAKLPAQG